MRGASIAAAVYMYAQPAPALMSLTTKKKQILVEDAETGMPVCLKGILGRPAAIIPVTRNGLGPPEDMNIS